MQSEDYSGLCENLQLFGGLWVAHARPLVRVAGSFGLIDAYNNYHMGVTAENVAEKWNISRKDQDNFALSSQNKTEKAQKKGNFKNEIISIENFDTDEHSRNGMTIEKLEQIFENIDNLALGPIS